MVLLLAFVATLIPKKPAKPDAKAPTINERDISALESDLPEFAYPRIKATAKTKTARIRYSARKNAIAPSAILLPMDCILSFPSFCLLIQEVFQKANAIAITPDIITNKI